jgi:V/A-type H+-transporting ATPase subunit K
MYTVKLKRILGVSCAMLAIVVIASPAFAQTEDAGLASWFRFGPATLCIAGAALAVILSGIGSAVGIGYAGRASLGAMSEGTKDFAKYLMLTALPGTQGIYGFVAGFLVMLWSGVMAGETGALTIAKGWQFFYSSLPVAFAGLFSAIQQGKVCASGVNMTTKQPGEVGKALVLGVFVEFYAVLGLLITILLLISIRG